MTATDSDSSTNGSFLDYVGAATGITGTIVNALNAGSTADAAKLNANAAALNATAAKTKANSYTKIAIIGGIGLVVIVVLALVFKRK